MAKVEGNKLILSKEETELVKNHKELELIPNQEGVFLLIDKEVALKKEGAQVCVQVPEHKEEIREEVEEVIGLVKHGKLSELVEGKFEEKLTPDQKEILKDLITKGKVFVFKLNESYKKGVYRVKEEGKDVRVKENVKKESENFLAEKKQYPDYTLEVDGFIATLNNDRAKILSQEYRERIEAGELKGIRNFEGVYYLIENELLVFYSEKVLEKIKEKKEATLEGLAEEINISIELTKIVCEFVKEEGEILEKRKGKFIYIN